MILIADRNGQLGNRLWTFAHFIGWGLAHGVRIVNPGFRDYARYFEGTCDDPWCRYPIKSAGQIDALTRRAFYPSIYFTARQARKFNIRTPWMATLNNKGDIFDLNIHTEELLASRLTIVRGWQYRDDINFQKYREEIRSHFTPKLSHRERIAECIARARAKCQVLVGVHIRRGDYSKHLDGRYFYDHAAYRDMMEKVRSLFADKEVGFLICSNEPVETSRFKGFNLSLGTNHIVEDMYSFASCDYVFGPPSTYSIWASYYGRVPLFEMTSSSACPKLEDFKLYST